MTDYPSYIRTDEHKIAYERAKNEFSDIDPEPSQLYAKTAEILRLWDTDSRRPTEWERVAEANRDDREPYEIANDMHGRQSQRPYVKGYADLQYKIKVRAPLSDDEKERIREAPDWLLKLPDDYDPTEPL